MPLIVVIGLLVLVAGAAIFIFNRLVGLKNRARGSWSDIDVQLKRRHDLVANLVETVKGYAQHERGTLEEVTRARAHAEGARDGGDPKQTGEAENLLTGRMRGLFALAEAYPDLKASDRFLDLQRALADLENDIQNARRYYNAVVRDLNTRIQSFPDLLLARPLGFKEWDFFELEDAAEAAAPRVDLSRPE
jgi:LemA protein